ncbi:hypothetical protein ACFXI6_08135 [Streptomyces mirabilis]|uniref:hypothetical protein n=1 Tax=Streptomyces mirabilis TaxID=68239 RepID=UPI0036B98942
MLVGDPEPGAETVGEPGREGPPAFAVRQPEGVEECRAGEGRLVGVTLYFGECQGRFGESAVGD